MPKSVHCYSSDVTRARKISARLTLARAKGADFPPTSMSYVMRQAAGSGMDQLSRSGCIGSVDGAPTHLVAGFPDALAAVATELRFSRWKHASTALSNAAVIRWAAHIGLDVLEKALDDAHAGRVV